MSVTYKYVSLKLPVISDLCLADNEILTEMTWLMCITLVVNIMLSDCR